MRLDLRLPDQGEWQATLKRMGRLEFERLERSKGEVDLYQKLLLAMLSLDSSLLQGAKGEGAFDLMRVYDEETNQFGIHAFTKDLYRARALAFRGKEEESRLHFRLLVMFMEKHGWPLAVEDWIKNHPQLRRYRQESYQAIWLNTYRRFLQKLPYSWRRRLEPLARRVADFAVFEAETDHREDLSPTEKERTILERLAQEQEAINRELRALGLPDGLITPRGDTSLPETNWPWEKEPTGLKKASPF